MHIQDCYSLLGHSYTHALHRATCSEQEFDELVQRNMAANCGLDFRAAAKFVGCIAARELSLMKDGADQDRASALMRVFNLRRVLPVLEGLLRGLTEACTPERDRSGCAATLDRDGSLAERSCRSCFAERYRSAASEAEAAATGMHNRMCRKCRQSHKNTGDQGTASGREEAHMTITVEDVLSCQHACCFDDLLRALLRSLGSCLDHERSPLPN
jgi:hypothetical protein